MQHLKWFLFLVFGTLVATNKQQTDVDTVLEKVKLNSLENVLDQDLRRFSKQMACKLRPEIPGCRQRPSTKEQTVLSKLPHNSAWKNDGTSKFENSVEKRENMQQKCRPRPGAAWCRARR